MTSNDFATGGLIEGPDDGSDRIPIMLSRGYQVTDPDEAEALGLTVDARRMREAMPTPPLGGERSDSPNES